MKNSVHIPVADVMFTSKCNMRCKYCFEDKKTGKNLTMDEFKPYLKNKSILKFFLFGGEPFMNSKFLHELYDFVEKELDCTDYVKGLIIKSTKKIITNGTLVDKNIDLIKDNDLEIQISLDGNKEANDINRIFSNNEGSFEKIMENVKICVDNDLKFSLHGVVNRETLSLFKDISVAFFETNWKYRGLEEAINAMGKNVFQIIFEDEYTDDDIDVLLEQMYQTCEYFFRHEKLNLKQKKQLIHNFLSRQGGKCGAGYALLAIDVNMDIYPCHRQADNSDFDLDNMRMGNIYDAENVKNFKVYNTFFNIGNEFKFLYGYNYFNREFKNGKFYWHNWCPSTNALTSGTQYYTSSKYTIMITELNRLIKVLMKYYKVDQYGNSRHTHR